MVKKISLSRPDDDILFGKGGSPKDNLKTLREKKLSQIISGKISNFSDATFQQNFETWLADFNPDKRTHKKYLKIKGNEAWLLAQFALSKLRTTVVQEIGDRSE
jgi:hypothetical protein